MTTKVAIVTNILTPYRIPLFNELNKFKNFNFTVYLLAENEKNRFWSIDDVKFECKLLPDYGVDLSNRIKFICHFNPHIISEIQKQNFDLIICAGYDSFTALLIFFMSKIKRIPLIFWSGSTEYESNNKIIRFVGKPIIKTFSKYSNGFIAYGSRAEQFLINNGAQKSTIFKSYNTVDVDYYKTSSKNYSDQKQQILESNNIKNSKCILYVGQLIERKGVKTLIDAFKIINNEIENVSLLIIGEGRQKQQYIDYCSENGISNVYFLGHKNIDEMPKYYSISDVFVLPSLSEVWGLVINEAMASGLPIITTDAVGASEDLIINGQNGYVVKAGSVDELHKVMRNILMDDNLRCKMRKQSLEIISNYSIKQSAEGFTDAILYQTNKL